DLEVAVAVGQEVVETLEAELLGSGERGELVGWHGSERDEPHRGGVDVDADDVLRGDAAQLRGDERAPVAALGAVALVVEAAHQFGPRSGDASRGPSGLMGRA